MLFLQKSFQLRHRENRLALGGKAQLFLVAVKRAQNAHAVVAEALVIQQRPAQTARAYDDGDAPLLTVQAAFQLSHQLQRIVAHLGTARAADRAQILANLYFAQPEFPGDRGGRNRVSRLEALLLQVLQITGQAAQRGLGQCRLLHAPLPPCVSGESPKEPYQL